MDLSSFSSFRVAACDLNGQMRGKRIPGSMSRALDKGTRMPLSALNVDIWGHDIADSPLVFASGDADGVLRPTDRGPVPMPWLDTPSALVPMMMFREDGSPFGGDPRQALTMVLDRYSARGWQVVAATEMEFTLVDDSAETLVPVRNPVTGRRLHGGSVLSLQELDAFDSFFTDLYSGCDAMGLPVETTIAESGIGQFEVTLHHQPAMRAADNAWLFKALARGLARRHGMAASFMAKLNPEDAGNGMHVHFSVVDGDGRNLFDDGGSKGTKLLSSAIAGCLASMPESTLAFAPFGNSYNRLVPGAHAPTGAAWGYENRTAAIRIPGGAPAARRIEHRSAGGDVNPYLLLAAILGAAMIGIDDAMTPPAPLSGNVYEAVDVPQMAADWPTAIDAFAAGPLIHRMLPAELIANFTLQKRQEMHEFNKIPLESHWQTLIDTA